MVVPFLQHIGYEVIICSPTAIAANKLKIECEKMARAHRESTNVKLPQIKDFYTLQRVQRLQYNDCPRVFIIDEASMMNIILFAKFLNIVKENDKVILVGDVNQLPPITGLSALKYVLDNPAFVETMRWDRTENRRVRGNDAQKLFNLFDNVRENGIDALKTTAFGNKTIFDGDDNVSNHFITQSALNISKLVKILFDQYQIKSIDNFDDILFVSHKKDTVNKLNKEVRKLLNLDGEFCINDRIIFTKNNYYNMIGNTREEPYYNGLQGRVINIDDENDIMTINCDGADIRISSGITDIQHRYAMTVHKSQGQGFRYICFVVDGFIADNELIYTAVTRAKTHIRTVLINTDNIQLDKINTTHLSNNGKILLKYIQRYVNNLDEYNKETLISMTNKLVRAEKLTSEQGKYMKDLLNKSMPKGQRLSNDIIVIIDEFIKNNN